ncbi:hypothetical protein N7454_006142 [Penicillium verhagenii]|nr:hypothetical protein N7454_006142 [Penicillium verhagenii]
MIEIILAGFIGRDAVATVHASSKLKDKNHQLTKAGRKLDLISGTPFSTRSDEPWNQNRSNYFKTQQVPAP